MCCLVSFLCVCGYPVCDLATYLCVYSGFCPFYEFICISTFWFFVPNVCVRVCVCILASRWAPCQNAVRHQDVNDQITWLTSPAAAAATIPAPRQMKKKRRREEKQEEEVERKEGRRKFPTTSVTARRRTWLSAQVRCMKVSGKFSLGSQRVSVLTNTLTPLLGFFCFVFAHFTLFFLSTVSLILYLC